MKKVLFITVLAIALTLALATAAYADHSPGFYIQWNATGGFEGANAAVPTPHAGYVEGTQKCGCCHAVHRAPVPGLGWTDDNPSQAAGGATSSVQPPGTALYPAEAGGTNRATRQVFRAPTNTGDTQMLLQTSVADACDYCHITTSVGRIQLYGGAIKYRLEANTAAGGSDWEGGFAHNNGCNACHAVHGAFANPWVANPTVADNVVFKGAMADKVLKAYAKNRTTTWQRETYLMGTGVNAATRTFYFGAGPYPTASAQVAASNVPLFTSKAAALAGTVARNGVDIGDAQVSVFCTFCHENYGWASENTINGEFAAYADPAALYAAIGTNSPANEAYAVGKGLFQGPWEYKGFSVRNSATTTSGAGGAGWDGHVPVKNHPMKDAATSTLEANWSAGGGSYVEKVAWAASDTCRSCHDAGQESEDVLGGGDGVIISSFPHFTPGYFKFLKAADFMGDTMTNIEADLADPETFTAGSAPLAAFQASILDSATIIEEAEVTADGACLKCHVDSANLRGVGLTF